LLLSFVIEALQSLNFNNNEKSIVSYRPEGALADEL
jgi:hypothetical protein